jgi:hypothetical protein
LGPVNDIRREMCHECFAASAACEQQNRQNRNAAVKNVSHKELSPSQESR